MANVTLETKVVQDAPLAYTIPGAQEIAIIAARASYDGSAATGPFVPTLRIIAPDGQELVACPIGVTLAAGASADASWFPHVGANTNGGIQAGIRFDTYPQSGDWLWVKTTGENTTDGDAGDFGIAFETAGVGGFVVQDEGAGGISLTAAGTGEIDIASDVGSGGITIFDFSDNGVNILSRNAGGVNIGDQGSAGVAITAEAGSTGGIFMVDQTVAGGLFIVGDSTEGVHISSDGASSGGIFLADNSGGGVHSNSVGGFEVTDDSTVAFNMTELGSNLPMFVENLGGGGVYLYASGDPINLTAVGGSGAATVTVQISDGDSFAVANQSLVEYFRVTANPATTSPITLPGLPTAPTGVAGDVYRDGAGANVALKIV